MRSTVKLLARNDVSRWMTAAFQVLSKLPQHGVGTKLSRTTWKEDSYWAITNTKIDLDGKHGKAYGILTWRGQQQNQVPKRINGAAKKVWRVLGDDRPADEWPSLVVPSLLEKSDINDVEASSTSNKTTESGTLS